MEYYGREPSSDFFMHYGVKGIKWGVRRALKKNDMSKLAYHYQRAVNKNKVLKDRTSIKNQKDDAKSYAAAGGALLGLGALGGLASYGMLKGQKKLNNLIAPNSAYEHYMVPTGLIGASALSAAGGLASLGAGAASAYRTTKRGNKKAIEKQKNFSKEMNTAFNKQLRSKVQKHLREHPEDRFDYNPYANQTVVHPMVPTVPNNTVKNKKKRRG